MTKGERSTMAGTMNPERAASSTTLQSWERRRAATETRSFKAVSSVAATTNIAPSSCPSSKSVASQRTLSSVSPGPLNSRATTSTRAPASRSSRTLRAATSPPPTTSTLWFLKSANKGK